MNGTLYGMVTDGGPSAFLATINTSTGVATPFGTKTFPQGNYTPVYDPSSNALYLSDFAILGTTLSSGRSTSDGIDRFDGTTGAMTFLGVGTAASAGLDVLGLAVNPVNGTLYGMVTDGGPSAFLATINTITGHTIRY